MGEQDDWWKQSIEVVAMDGFTGFKTAAVEELPHAVEVLDPFHVVKPEVGRWALKQLISEIGTKVPKGLPELKKLGGTLRRRKTDILAYFDHIGSSNGPTEALKGRLEHLRGIALGFRNLTHYIARSLLEAGGFRTGLRPELRRASNG